MFLTPDELAELTGRRQREKQAEALRKARIPYAIVGGRVRVLKSAVEAVLGIAVTSPETEPNWGAWDDRTA